MSALEVIENIVQNENLIHGNFKYCFVTSNKVPMRYDGKNARPNNIEDFVDLEYLLQNENIESFSGVGVSIQASKISAIDVDGCFTQPFDVNTADDRAKEIMELFKEVAYIEFSFSGKGLRVFFKSDVIDNYASIYYIKNSKVNIEYYQSNDKSFRYVTITGRTIFNNPIQNCPQNVLFTFLNKFMLRPKQIKSEGDLGVKIEETRSFEELWSIFKYHYFKNMKLQDATLNKFDRLNFGSESDQDWYIISYIYNNITKDKEMIKRIFENTYFFKHKDKKHLYKWEYNDNRYYNYIYSHLI